MDTTTQTTPIYVPQDGSLEEYTKFRTSVNARFTSTDDATWQKWNEEHKNNPKREISLQEWTDFVKANKEAHTPAITDEMVKAASNEIELPKAVVTRQYAQTMLNVAAEAERDLRALAATKALNFDDVSETRALDARVAGVSEMVICIANAL